MIQDTAGQIINYAAVECGLSAVSDPFASGDPSFIQLCTLLTMCGRELVKAKEWRVLTKTGTADTAADGTITYPADLDRLINNTLGGVGTDGFENRTLLTKEYGRAQRQSATPFAETNDYSAPYDDSMFEKSDNTVEILPSVAVGTTYAFMYISQNWVRDAVNTALFKTAPTNSSDVVLFESLLVVKLLKLRFLEAKGFDTSAATQQFVATLATVSSGDRTAPILDLSVPFYQQERLIDEYNLPNRV